MNTTTTEDSFISAWSKAQFPGENRTFVKSFCDEIGISAFEYKPRSYSYIAATRRDGTGELRKCRASASVKPVVQPQWIAPA